MAHFSAACFTVMYINLHLTSNSSIPYYRNDINDLQSTDFPDVIGHRTEIQTKFGNFVQKCDMSINNLI